MGFRVPQEIAELQVELACNPALRNLEVHQVVEALVEEQVDALVEEKVEALVEEQVEEICKTSNVFNITCGVTDEEFFLSHQSVESIEEIHVKISSTG